MYNRPPAGITVEQWADDLKLVLDDIGIDRTHIFGTSNGSFIVIRFAAKYPQRTAAIAHYGMHKLTDQSRKMSRIGAKICDEFGVGNGSMGAYFLVRLYSMPPEFEEWETRRFEENLHPQAWKAMHEALELADWVVAYENYTNVGDAEEQVAVWGQFSPKQRREMKKEFADIRAQAGAVVNA